MRSLFFATLLALSLISNTLAAPPHNAADLALPRADTKAPLPQADIKAPLPQADTKAPASPADDPVVAGKTEDPPVTNGGNSLKGTLFNGHSVPPLTELSGETIDTTIANGYWYAQDMLNLRTTPY